MTTRTDAEPVTLRPGRAVSVSNPSHPDVAADATVVATSPALVQVHLEGTTIRIWVPVAWLTV